MLKTLFIKTICWDLILFLLECWNHCWLAVLEKIPFLWERWKRRSSWPSAETLIRSRDLIAALLKIKLPSTWYAEQPHQLMHNGVKLYFLLNSNKSSIVLCNIQSKKPISNFSDIKKDQSLRSKKYLCHYFAWTWDVTTCLQVSNHFKNNAK